MPTRLLPIVLLLSSLALAQPAARTGPSIDFSHGDLKVSDNHRFLIHADGTPFFYLADTGWEMFHRLDMPETEKYLENRRAAGFTAIQCVLIPEFNGLKIPNRQSHLPLIDNDPTKPSEEYFKDIDAVLSLAEKKGIYLALLPTWGDKVNKKWGEGPEIFTPENAKIYGAYLGNRYKDRPNIIWILGGDRPVENDRHREIWRGMAAGLQSADTHHLIGYHPMGGQSSAKYYPGEEPWLAFHMNQSGHSRRDGPNYDMIAKDYALIPTKPCFDGEPRYEDHPVRSSKVKGDYYNDFDTRQAAYWSVFAGSFGHTYGSHSIWSMHSEKFPAPAKLASEMLFTWDKAIDRPGGQSMAHLRRLIESRPFLSRVPAQDLIDGENPKDAGHIQCTRGDGYVMAYSPLGNPITLNLEKANLGAKIHSWLFNPRDGSAKELSPSNDMPADHKLTTHFPGTPARGNDWIVVIDDASKNWGAPGAEYHAK